MSIASHVAKLVGYTGLAPTVRQSSERTDTARSAAKGGVNCGPCGCRSPTWSHRQKEATQPLRTWFNRVARKRGKKTALVALARRLLVIAYQFLESEHDYDVGRLKNAGPRSRALEEEPESPGSSPKPPLPSLFPVPGRGGR